MKDYTREGLAISIVAHAALVAFAFTGLPMLGQDRPDAPQVIPIEFVEIATESRSPEPAPVIQESRPIAVPEETPEPEPEPAPEAVPEEAVPLPEEKPAPPQVVPEPEPSPEPKPERTPVRVTPRSKPQPPSRFDANRLAALIDRSIKEESAPPPSATEDTVPEQSAQTQQQAALSGRIATASLQAIIRDRVQQCWTLPAGAKGLDELHVRIRIYLRRDGTLASPPQIIDQARIARSNDSYLRIFAESARRAVQICEPYDELPVAYYDIWRQIDFNFNAGQMLGG